MCRLKVQLVEVVCTLSGLRLEPAHHGAEVTAGWAIVIPGHRDQAAGLGDQQVARAEGPHRLEGFELASDCIPVSASREASRRFPFDPFQVPRR